MIRATNRRAGFSLIEVMVSGVLLGLGVMVLAEMFGASTEGLSLGKSRTIGRQLAMQRLETLAASSPDLLPVCPPSPGCRADFSTLSGPLGSVDGFDCTQTVLESGFVSEQVDRADGRYRVDVSVSDPSDPNQIEGARLVRVSVCWLEQTRVEQVQVSRLVVPEV